VQLAPWAAIVALAGILVTMRFASYRSPLLFRGGFLVFALAGAVVMVVLATMPAAPISRALRVPVLVAIGLRSYSLYLWHWPVRVFVTSSSGLDGFTLFAARLAISVVLAELSYRLVEQPFRVGWIARKWGSRGAIAYYGALTLIAIVLVTTVVAPKSSTPTDLSKVKAGGNPDPNALHVDTFGDSTGLVFGLSGAANAQDLGISVGGDAQLGCGFVRTDAVAGGRVIKMPKICTGWKQRWEKALRDDPRARILLMTGAWEILDHKTDSGVVKFGTQEWTDLVTSSLRTALGVLTADGRTAYLFEVPCYGDGDVAEPIRERSDPKRIAALNEIYADVARSMPRVELVKWRTLVCPDGRRVEEIDGKRVWQSDEQHLTDDGAVAVWRWWLPQVR
jgi:hypothetical protein